MRSKALNMRGWARYDSVRLATWLLEHWVRPTKPLSQTVSAPLVYRGVRLANF